MNPTKVVVLLAITACVGVILYIVYLLLLLPRTLPLDPEEGSDD